MLAVAQHGRRRLRSTSHNRPRRIGTVLRTGTQTLKLGFFSPDFFSKQDCSCPKDAGDSARDFSWRRRLVAESCQVSLGRFCNAKFVCKFSWNWVWGHAHESSDGPANRRVVLQTENWSFCSIGLLIMALAAGGVWSFDRSVWQPSLVVCTVWDHRARKIRAHSRILRLEREILRPENLVQSQLCA